MGREEFALTGPAGFPIVRMIIVKRQATCLRIDRRVSASKTRLLAVPRLTVRPSTLENQHP